LEVINLPKKFQLEKAGSELTPPMQGVFAVWSGATD
jgi:hypothetical protein